MAGGDSGGIQKFILKTNKNNRFGQNKSAVKYGRSVLNTPYNKHKVPKKAWFNPSSNVFGHKKIQTPIPTPVSIKTGDRIEKSRATKQLEKIQTSYMPNNGKTTMKCI